MKLKIIAAASAAALVASAALADAKWAYDADAKTLTGILVDGETAANVFNISDAGVLSQNTVGDQTEIDLRAAAMPDGVPEIKQMGAINKYTSTTALRLPESLETMPDSLCSGLSALTEVTFPENPKFTKISSYAFQKTGLIDVTIPDGITVIGVQAFQECKSLVHVKLPETLEVFEKSAFSSTTAMKLIEPCFPASVTNLGQSVFVSCTMTNGVEIGFGTDKMTGEPLKMTFSIQTETNLRNLSFRACPNIKYFRIGPGVQGILPTIHFEMTKIDGLEWVEFGPNVTTFSDNFSSCGKLTNMVFRADADTPDFEFRNIQIGWADQSFHPLPSGLRDIVWERWFTYTGGSGNPFSNCGSRNLRFFVPGANLKWAAFIADSSRMTPWAEVSATDQAYYYSRYGTDAPTPDGLSVAVTDGLNRTWIVSDGKTPSGALLELGECWPQFASVTLSPEPQNDDGTYTAGTEVTVTFTPNADGVVFTGWTGTATNGLAEAAIASPSITVVATGVKTLSPTFTSTFLAYDEEKGELSDGTWMMVASGSLDAITLGTRKRTSAVGKQLLDLSRPVAGGGRIIAMKNSVSGVSGFKLPDTLESIAGFAQYWNTSANTGVTMEPLLPDSVTNVADSAFHWCPGLTGSLRIGFATNSAGESVETKVGSSAFTWFSNIGPEVRLGPGIRTISKTMFAGSYGGLGMKYDGPFDLWVGPNVSYAYPDSVSNIRRVNEAKSARPASVHFEGDMFDGTSGMFFGASLDGNKLVKWTGDGPLPYWIRFYVGADGCKEWKAFLTDRTKVTPWAELSDEVKAEYWTRFEKGDAYGTKRPYGLTTEAAAMTNDFPKAYGLPPNQWVFSLAQPGFVISVR